jgi:acyl-CoA hydrolase
VSTSTTPARGVPRDDRITLRFMSVPADTAAGGRSVAAGSVMEWIDKAGYACAVGWAGAYCVTAYVGNVRHRRPIAPGSLIEVNARIIHTGRSSMHVVVTVSSSEVERHDYRPATTCVLVFVAKGADGRPAAVPAWAPKSRSDQKLAEAAVDRIPARTEIKRLMLEQEYTDASSAPSGTMRFLAPPSVVNWGGKAHGGTVMRWIDEAAYVCAAGWNRGSAIAVYAGGVRFYRPLLIGSVVEVRARLVHTGRTSMHISVHVRSGDPKTVERQLTTHCMMIFVGLDEQRAAPVPQWVPVSDEDVALDAHARHLIDLRKQTDLLDRELPRAAR